MRCELENGSLSVRVLCIFMLSEREEGFLVKRSVLGSDRAEVSALSVFTEQRS
jgi:hypothetical protein